MSTKGHGYDRLELLVKTNSWPQAQLALQMKAICRHQLRLAQPMSARSHRQRYRALTQKCNRVGVSGLEKMRVMLPIPLQASTGKSITK
jgi:hypothetical protein